MLRKGADFSLLRAKGQDHRGHRLLFSWLPAPDGVSRLGLVVSKKYHRRAVHRNRARRLMRECFRLTESRFSQPVWAVLVARRGMSGQKLMGVQRELLYHCHQADLLAKKEGDDEDSR